MPPSLCQPTRARTMDIRFYIDPETGYPHIYRHGVEEYEVEDVLLDDQTVDLP